MTREIDRRLAALESRQPVDRTDPLKKMTPEEFEFFVAMIDKTGGLDDETAPWDMSALTDDERRQVREIVERVTR